MASLAGQRKNTGFLGTTIFTSCQKAKLTRPQTVTHPANELKNLRRRVNRARNFPANTCPASRHVQIMADNLTRKGGYPMLTEEPEHCAGSLYAVLASLWEDRTLLMKLAHAFYAGDDSKANLKLCKEIMERNAPFPAIIPNTINRLRNTGQ